LSRRGKEGEVSWYTGLLNADELIRRCSSLFTHGQEVFGNEHYNVLFPFCLDAKREKKIKALKSISPMPLASSGAYQNSLRSDSWFALFLGSPGIETK